MNPGPDELEKLKYRLEFLKTQQKVDKKAAKESKKRSLADAEDAGAPSTSKHLAILHKTVASTESGKVRHNLSRNKEVDDLTKKSIATDPKSSAVFKSLFTSSETAQTREHAHWVTYNPFYN
jgi:hypothetical protein